MQHEKAHPLLQQTPLTVNPFLSLPKAPTLPHNYVTLPPTLPPSILNSAPAASNADLPAYVTSSSGFAAHPASIIAQNKALLDQIARQREDGAKKIADWESGIKAQELAERRRKAPGWLDSETHLLEPAKANGDAAGADSLLDDVSTTSSTNAPALSAAQAGTSVNDLGDAMDRAFGRGGLQ